MSSPVALRTLDADVITTAAADIFRTANLCVPEEMRLAMEAALSREVSSDGRAVMQQLLDNYRLAVESGLPMCQDTGLAVFLVELGQDVHIAGDLYAAIQEGVRFGCREGFMRTSMVQHPFRRVNTGDNTPGVIHVTLVPGDKVRLTCLPKGGGCENASALRMLTPSAGRQGIIDFVVGRISDQGVNSCPPLVVGVGIGSNFEGCALLAKHALLRPLGRPAVDPDDAALEAELLDRINALGIGPGAFGGTVTALAVHVASAPCHIASMPCAVNTQCNAHRRVTVEL